MACDICGKTGVHLEKLRDEYRTDEVSDLCSGCMRITNDNLWKTRSLAHKMTQSLVKRFMMELRGKYKLETASAGKSP